MSTQAFITVEEAAEILGRSPAQVRYYCRNKLISAERYGRAWLLKREDVDGFEPPPVGNPTFQKQSK